ncbi:hypothetical protein [uncultured Tistrella sp.]|uniref:hypothetical protein n=1 Tax=Tistrella mobilis TaxID=171437 RepID=UPI000C0A05B9|nr:hypothetical protein [uncultured Tistrella sp.]MAM72293.1 hypothetical protein [Tistrella sp.]
MANASKKHIGIGSQGKGSGAGAMTDLPGDVEMGDNEVLSNRDKAQGAKTRGFDGKATQTDQYQDHEANRRTRDAGETRGGPGRTQGSGGEA